MIQFAHWSFFHISRVLCLHLHCKCFSFVSRQKCLSPKNPFLTSSHYGHHHSSHYYFLRIFTLYSQRAQQSLRAPSTRYPRAVLTLQSLNCKCTQRAPQMFTLIFFALLPSVNQRHTHTTAAAARLFMNVCAYCHPPFFTPCAPHHHPPIVATSKLCRVSLNAWLN